MASSTEAELGGFFENFQKATSIQTTLAEMGLPQLPIRVEIDDTEANIIVNGTT